MKKTLYPKTKRISNAIGKISITEKMDGSNLGFFKLNGELVIATRNNVLEIGDPLIKGYKGLDEWLEENSEVLLDSLHEGSGTAGS